MTKTRSIGASALTEFFYWVAMTVWNYIACLSPDIILVGLWCTVGKQGYKNGQNYNMQQLLIVIFTLKIWKLLFQTHAHVLLGT